MQQSNFQTTHTIKLVLLHRYEVYLLTALSNDCIPRTPLSDGVVSKITSFLFALDQAMMTTLAGLIIVLTMVIEEVKFVISIFIIYIFNCIIIYFIKIIQIIF